MTTEITYCNCEVCQRAELEYRMGQSDNMDLIPRRMLPGVNIDVIPLQHQTEKEAIDAARALRIAEIDRLQQEVDALDKRYDQIEDEEMESNR